MSEPSLAVYVCPGAGKTKTEAYVDLKNNGCNNQMCGRGIFAVLCVSSETQARLALGAVLFAGTCMAGTIRIPAHASWCMAIREKTQADQRHSWRTLLRFYDHTHFCLCWFLRHGRARLSWFEVPQEPTVFLDYIHALGG